MKKKIHIAVLWLLFIMLMAVRILITMDYWILIQILACGLAVALLIKCKLPSKKSILLSVFLTFLVAFSYFGAMKYFGINNFAVFIGNSPCMIATLLSSLAVLSVMEKRGGFYMIPKDGKHPKLKFFIFTFVAGTLLVGISILVAFLSSSVVTPEFSIWKYVICFNPGIFEEMACRAIFMAFCIGFSEDKMSGFEVFTMLFMMTMPHCIVHGKGLIETALLFVIFGIPLAFVQRKNGIVSAMIIHAIVDAVMFTVTGLSM